MTDDRRGELLGVKLRALAGARLGGADAVSGDFPGGAALVAGDAAWVLLDERPVTALGPALVWADRRGAADVHLVIEDGDAAGVIARRARCFSAPPSVWTVDGADLAPAEPSPVPVTRPAEPASELAALLVDADLEVLVEDGTVRGEVLGLEVARVVHGTSSAGVPLDAPLLEVGVGQADRELTGMLHGDLPPRDQLARVIDIVRRHRTPDASPHPLNQLVPDRWLRSRLVAEPSRIGMRELRPVEAAIPRANLRDRGVAVAVGTRSGGGPAVVACSVGIDLDLVPAAADARLAVDPDADLVVVVPARDAHPVTRALAARLARPADVVALEGDWRR